MNDKLVRKDRLINETTLRMRLERTASRWEFILFLTLIGVFVFFSFISPYFLDYFNLMNASFSFVEKSILALPMIFVILSGDIDISVASTMALSSFVMGNAASKGAGAGALVLLGLATGLAAGMFNGILVTKVKIPAIAVTLATLSVFRGISQAILRDNAYTVYPEKFAYFGQGYIPGTVIPFGFVFYFFLAIVIGFVLHGTTYGRKLYAIGNSASASRSTGIEVDRIRFINFTLNGLFAGIAAVLLTSRIGSTRPNIANGWELEAITLVVLGGVAITGGKGNIFGVVIASLLVGYLKFGMALVSLSAKVMVITTGTLLIVAVLIPKMLEAVKAQRKLHSQRSELMAGRKAS
ncbi:MAG: ABC transporter permease [Spirochaetaceae bacterium]|nr:ABC transporter permease [Spirochaetaceae bacterium]